MSPGLNFSIYGMQSNTHLKLSELVKSCLLNYTIKKKHISRPLGRGPCKNKKYHAMSKMIVCFCALWGSLAPSDHTKHCRSMLHLFIARGHGHWASEKKFYPLLPQLVRSPNFRKLRSGDPKPLQILKISWRIRVHFRAKKLGEFFTYFSVWRWEKLRSLKKLVIVYCRTPYMVKIWFGSEKQTAFFGQKTTLQQGPKARHTRDTIYIYIYISSETRAEWSRMMLCYAVLYTVMSCVIC